MRKPKYIGVYSDNTSGRNKGGAITVRQFYFVWLFEDGNYAVQKLDKSLVPRGPVKLVSPQALKAGFHAENSILAAPMSTPDFRQIIQPREERAAELNDETLRELEKARKAKQVENDLRNNFNKALRALNRPRDRKGALAAIEQLAAVKDGIVPAHKHMFRDFGVSLRKKSLPEQALMCARRAVELAPEDDHAHFNMARILSILGLYGEARAHLRKAMAIDSSEKVYKKLDDYIQKEVN